MVVAWRTGAASMSGQCDGKRPRSCSRNSRVSTTPPAQGFGRRVSTTWAFPPTCARRVAMSSGPRVQPYTRGVEIVDPSEDPSGAPGAAGRRDGPRSAGVIHGDAALMRAGRGRRDLPRGPRRRRVSGRTAPSTRDQYRWASRSAIRGTCALDRPTAATSPHDRGARFPRER